MFQLKKYEKKYLAQFNNSIQFLKSEYDHLKTKEISIIKFFLTLLLWGIALITSVLGFILVDVYKLSKKSDNTINEVVKQLSKNKDDLINFSNHIEILGLIFIGSLLFFVIWFALQIKRRQKILLFEIIRLERIEKRKFRWQNRN